MPLTGSRSVAVVRRADPQDKPQLLEIVGELRQTSGRSSRPFGRETAALAYRLDDLLRDEAATVLVAETDAGACGMAVLTVAPLTSLTDVPTMRMDYAVVARRCRRQGVGRALIAAAALQAEEAGMEQLAVAVVPGDRESNRFYARLGFAPVILRRTTQVTALRRKLAAPEQRPLMGDLTTRRRLLRRPVAPPRRTLPGAAGGS